MPRTTPQPSRSATAWGLPPGIRARERVVAVVSVVEAPDDRVIVWRSLELGSRGTARDRSCSAVPIDELLGAL